MSEKESQIEKRVEPLAEDGPVASEQEEIEFMFTTILGQITMLDGMLATKPTLLEGKDTAMLKDKLSKVSEGLKEFKHHLTRGEEE